LIILTDESEAKSIATLVNDDGSWAIDISSITQNEEYTSILITYIQKDGTKLEQIINEDIDLPILFEGEQSNVIKGTFASKVSAIDDVPIFYENGTCYLKRPLANPYEIEKMQSEQECIERYKPEATLSSNAVRSGVYYDQTTNKCMWALPGKRAVEIKYAYEMPPSYENCSKFYYTEIGESYPTETNNLSNYPKHLGCKAVPDLGLPETNALKEESIAKATDKFGNEYICSRWGGWVPSTVDTSSRRLIFCIEPNSNFFDKYIIIEGFACPDYSVEVPISFQIKNKSVEAIIRGKDVGVDISRNGQRIIDSNIFVDKNKERLLINTQRNIPSGFVLLNLTDYDIDVSIYEDVNQNGRYENTELLSNAISQWKYGEVLDYDLINYNIWQGWNYLYYPFKKNTIPQATDSINISKFKDVLNLRGADIKYIINNGVVVAFQGDVVYGNGESVITPGTNLYIYSDKAKSMIFSGEFIAKPSDVGLRSGWNTVPNTFGTTTAKEVLDKTRTGNPKAISVAIYVSNQYKTYEYKDGLYYGNDFAIYPENALYIRAE